MDKHQTILKIIREIFRLEVLKGHLKWSVTTLAKATGISRPTIYSYFGQSKNDILLGALRFICEEYYGLSKDRLSLAETDFVASAVYTKSLMDGTPGFSIFYQKWRFQKSEIQSLLIKYENRYQEKLLKLGFAKDAFEARYLHALLHGLITAPFLADKDFRKSIERFTLSGRTRTSD